MAKVAALPSPAATTESPSSCTPEKSSVLFSLILDDQYLDVASVPRKGVGAWHRIGSSRGPRSQGASATRTNESWQTPIASHTVHF